MSIDKLLEKVFLLFCPSAERIIDDKFDAITTLKTGDFLCFLIVTFIHFFCDFVEVFAVRSNQVH